MNYRKILAKNTAGLKANDQELNSNAKIAARCSTPTRKVAATAIGYMMDSNSAINPKLDTIVAFAEVFKVRPADLLDPDFDPKSRKKAKEGEPTLEELALARRIAALPEERRELLMDIFMEAVPDGELEAAGFAAPGRRHTLQETAVPYRKSPRQLRMKLKRG